MIYLEYIKEIIDSPLDLFVDLTVGTFPTPPGSPLISLGLDFNSLRRGWCWLGRGTEKLHQIGNVFRFVSLGLGPRPREWDRLGSGFFRLLCVPSCPASGSQARSGTTFLGQDEFLSLLGKRHWLGNFLILTGWRERFIFAGFLDFILLRLELGDSSCPPRDRG